MLFNSYIFIFAFLPVTLFVFVLARRYSRRAAIPFVVLSIASLIFYGYASLEFLGIFIGSMFVNALVVYFLQTKHVAARFSLATLGVIFNLGFIGYFKYRDFFLATLEGELQGTGFSLLATALPIGISFYTFQQIAYIADAYNRKTGIYDPLKHLLFISFFPQLIAGPIVHHSEMMPQFDKQRLNMQALDIAVGLSIFAIGLFKKVIVADGIAPTADAVFLAAETGAMASPAEAWMGALAFTLQLYFDFSGYSDMAIGLARMFGIVLPINFNSPYKASSIIDFWRRWHMTLSRFLRDYLYIPLGGGRRGKFRRYANILIVMSLAGLWHGAGWTFVFWGLIHGVLLAANHAWRAAVTAMGIAESRWLFWLRPVFVALTFGVVVVAWVPFRAASFDSALRVWSAMSRILSPDGMNSAWTVLLELRLAITNVLFLLDVAWRGTAFPDQRNWDLLGRGDFALLALLVGFFVIFALPNTAEIFRRVGPVLDFSDGRTAEFSWRMSSGWALIIAVLFVAAVLNLSAVSPFLYFQF